MNRVTSLFCVLIVLGMCLFAAEQYCNGAGADSIYTRIVGAIGMFLVFGVLYIWKSRYSK